MKPHKANRDTALIAEMLKALRAMQRASDEIAAEFIERKRAANWGIVNDAYVSAERAIAKAERYQ